MQVGLHNTPLGSQPASTLHSRSAVARQPLGPPAHTADLVFPPTPSMAAAGDGSEPTLDVSTWVDKGPAAGLGPQLLQGHGQKLRGTDHHTVAPAPA